MAAEPTETLPEEILTKVAEVSGSMTAPARELAQKVGFSRFPDSIATFIVEMLANVGGER